MRTLLNGDQIASQSKGNISQTEREARKKQKQEALVQNCQNFPRGS